MNLDQVLPKLFVGSGPRDRSDVSRLRTELGITVVLNLQTDEDLSYLGVDWEQMESAYRALGMEVRPVPVMDFNSDDLRLHLPACIMALDEMLRDGHRVYVHCSGGVNRSPTVVVAYFHRVLGDGIGRGVGFRGGAAPLRAVCRSNPGSEMGMSYERR